MYYIYNVRIMRHHTLIIRRTLTEQDLCGAKVGYAEAVDFEYLMRTVVYL